jgi:hypothetical protein
VVRADEEHAHGIPHVRRPEAEAAPERVRREARSGLRHQRLRPGEKQQGAERESKDKVSHDFTGKGRRRAADPTEPSATGFEVPEIETPPGPVASGASDFTLSEPGAMPRRSEQDSIV